MKILLVDDEIDLVTTLSTILKKWGHEVVSASDGVEAQKVLEKNTVDVIISDLIMPNMDGGELLTWINAMPQKPHFIIMSAYYNEGFIKYFSDQGITNILGKPIQFDKLQSMLNRISTQTSTTVEPVMVQPGDQKQESIEESGNTTASKIAKLISDRLLEAKNIVVANTTTGVPYTAVSKQQGINVAQFAQTSLAMFVSLQELWKAMSGGTQSPKEILFSDESEKMVYQHIASPELFVHVEVSPGQVTHGLLRMTVDNVLKENAVLVP